MTTVNMLFCINIPCFLICIYSKAHEEKFIDKDYLNQLIDTILNCFTANYVYPDKSMKLDDSIKAWNIRREYSRILTEEKIFTKKIQNL